MEEEELSPRERKLEKEWGGDERSPEGERERERSAEEERRGEEWSGREC